MDSVARPLANSPFVEQAPAVSPDSRWIAYETRETGRDEVVVRPFPDVNGGRYPISTDGGTLPLWAHNGHELFYLDAQNDVMSVQVDTRNGFHVGKMTRLFHLGSEYLFSSHDGTYDIAPDDQRFLFVRGPGADSKGPPGIILVENWTQEVKAKLGR